MNAQTEFADKSDAAGQLALAIVLKDLESRVARADLTEADARDLVSRALERLPADAYPAVHALVDR